jgi:hypothetical protein
VWSWSQRRLMAGVLALAGCLLAIVLLSGCDGGAAVATSPSPTDTTMSLSPTPAWPGPEGRLSISITTLRSGFKSAFASGRTGKPYRASPSAVIIALKRYFASVDPNKFISGANRVAFVWAFTPSQPVGGQPPSPTLQYVVAYFLADGPDMIAAGSIAPGFNAHLMSLSRSSPDDAWQVDGLYFP